MSLFKQVLGKIENRKRRVESGNVNSIPLMLPKLGEFYGGIEKGKYEMVTGPKKSGKSQMTGAMYVYYPVRYCMDTGSDLDIEVDEICLEMTAEQKMIQAMCHFLFIDSEGLIRVSPQDLRSTKGALSDEVLNTIIRYEPFFVKYLDKVRYHDKIRTVDEIDAFFKNLCTKVDPKSEKINQVIIDHISLVIPRRQQTLKQAVDEVSSQICVSARNNFRINPIIVQQQANEKEGFEARKLNDMTPSFSGLSDSKDTARDIDTAFGIFSPAAAKMPIYGGRDVSKLGDSLRIVNILGGRESNGQKEVACHFDGAVSYFKEM